MAGGKQKVDEQRAALQSSAKAVQYQVLLQFGSRLLTFVLNGFIIHYVSKELLGIVNIRLMLLYTTIQFLSREGFRRACTQSFGQARGDWKPVINLLWLNTPLSGVFAIALSLLWYYCFSLPPCGNGKLSVGCYYAHGVIAYAAAACIESIAEPFFVTGQAYHFVRTRVLVQGAAITLQTFINAVGCLAIVRGFGMLRSIAAEDRNQYMLLVFAFAQLCYSVSICVMYMLFFAFYLRRRKTSTITGKPAVTVDIGLTDASTLPMQRVTDFFPTISLKNADCWLSVKHARLAYSFTKQGIIKQLLTEGERYIMTITRVIDFHQQGIYDIVNNLGALCVRTVFAPLEENAYLFFSRAFPRYLHVEPNETLLLSTATADSTTCIESAPCLSDVAVADKTPPALNPVSEKGDADDISGSLSVAENTAHANKAVRRKKPVVTPAVDAAPVHLSAAEKQHSLDTLFHLLRFVVLLGSTAFVYGFNYCDIVLRIYGGNELAQNGTVMMQMYCFYLVFLAANGILEAFAFAVMTDVQVQQSSRAFIKISGFYVVAALLFTWRGHAAGFILANCCNMLARIVYSYGVASRYLDRFTQDSHSSSTANVYSRSSSLVLHAVVPHITVLKSLLVAGFFCYISKVCIYQGTSKTALFSLPTLGHLVIGGLFGLITLWSIWKFEQETVVFIGDIMRGRKQATTDEKSAEVPERSTVAERTKAE